MEIITGDRYLDHLVKFVERSAEALLEGSLTLKLNPVGLHYVQSRLEALQELERLLAGAPVDYLRAYVSDLGDHRALEQLRRILGLLTSLKVISVLPHPARDPTPVSIQAFGSLRVLEFRGCDLSTSSPRGLLELRGTLEKLICHNSTDALRHVFASRIADIKDSPVWTRLNFVSCAHNRLVLMDESLQLLPSVETLDLSRNQFAKVDNLGRSSKLRHLDLGFNHLRTIACLSKVSCPIVKLVLRNNALTTLQGLENLKSIEGLDLSCNLISSFSELEVLAKLPCLKNLWLEGNPLCYARWYRSYVFSFFPHPETLILDDNSISTKEYWERHFLYTSRQKQPPAYGFYFPAEDHSEARSSASAYRKKHSRLANIDDEEQRKHLYMEAIERDSSLSCDGDVLGKDENADPDDESKIVGLMNKVEHMKKERSVFWLREFKDWMDQSSEVTSNRNQPIDYKSDSQIEQSRKPLEYPNLGESSSYANNTTGGSFSNIIHYDASDSGILNENDGIAMEPSTEDDGKYFEPGLRLQEVLSEEDGMKVDSGNLENRSPLILNDRSSINSSAVGGSASMVAIDEIIGSHSSSICPGSPPHYQEDILHRRLNLEEEFLQLSAESLSVKFSDSDTSCSDDESCEFNLSLIDYDSTCIQESTAESSNHFHANNHLWNGYGHDDSFSTVKNKFLSKYHSKHYTIDTTEEACASCHSNLQLSHGDGDAEKINCKQHLKKGFVSLFGNMLTCSSQSRCEKVNGALDFHRFDNKGEQGEPSCCGNGFSSGAMNGKAIQLNHRVETVSASGFDKNKRYEYIKALFNTNISDSEAFETCQQIVFCGCIYQHGSFSRESEAALLRSCKNKLYVLLLDKTDDGIDTRVSGCYNLDEIKEVVTGLGLQALRVCMEGNKAYLFLTRTIEMSDEFFRMLQLVDSGESTVNCSLKSWEQVQVDLLEKHISGRLTRGIYFYSMILLLLEGCEGKSWLSRSLFVIEGYIILCSENLMQFGSPTDSPGTRPYYTFDSLCPIQNILDLVIESKESSRCLTLIAENIPSGNFLTGDQKDENHRREYRRSCTWKLKWFSEDYLLKFVTLVKAMHLGLSANSLRVK